MPGRRSAPPSQAQSAALARFLTRTRPVQGGVVGPGFYLRDVVYTSPSDAAANFYSCDVDLERPCVTVVVTTDDNWRHAAGLAIPHDVADTVDWVPLGQGAVAVKAKMQLVRSYPPFILFPDGGVEILDIAQRRPFEAGSAILESHLGGFLYQINAARPRVWAADVADRELYSLTGAPVGVDLWGRLDNVSVRGGTVASTMGYRQRHDGGVWRSNESTDGGRTWRRVDVRLPLGSKVFWQYAGDSNHLVGPGDMQAIAMADAPPDVPLLMWELWRTDDERAFHRVPLPGQRVPYAGMAFAADGSLLVARVRGPVTTCTMAPHSCERSARIWRLPPRSTHWRPLRGAPRLSGRHGLMDLRQSGGVIVARTGDRTVAVSSDGYRWTEVAPGR